MRRLRFIVVGSGWRSLFFYRIAKALPEYFELCGLLCRTEEKAKALQEEHGIRTSISAEECAQMKPDFAVIAVNKDAICPVAKEWIGRGVPVLCETPAAVTLEDLKELWRLRTEEGALIQVAEQYFKYPTHAAGIALAEAGYLGDPYALNLSMVHDYHAASLIRKYLGVGFETVALYGKKYCFPVEETDSRAGAITDGRVSEKERARVTLEFGNGKVAFYDFSGVQYHSFIRSRHLLLQGQSGELDDKAARYVGEGHLPVETELRACLSSGRVGIRKVIMGDVVLYENPFGDIELTEDETAIADLMVRMGAYVDGGEEGYPLAEGLQDAYIAILMDEALKNPGVRVVSEVQAWNVG